MEQWRIDMNNNVMLFMCKDGIQRINIDYTISIPRYNKVYTGSSINNYIVINTGNTIHIENDDEIYVTFTYNSITYYKYYKYLGDGIEHVIDAKDPLYVVGTLNYVTSDNIYNIQPTLDTANTISYIKYKLSFTGGIASEVGDTNLEDILVLDTIKDISATLKLYFIVSGVYKLSLDIIDINNNIKTIDGDNIVIDTSTNGNNGNNGNRYNGNGFRNKTNYIEWE